MLLVLIDSPQRGKKSLHCMHILVKNWIKSDFRENVQKKRRLPQTYLMFVNILFANFCTCFDFSISKSLHFLFNFSHSLGRPSLNPVSSVHKFNFVPQNLNLLISYGFWVYGMLGGFVCSTWRSSCKNDFLLSCSLSLSLSLGRPKNSNSTYGIARHVLHA